jgi:hypothetical protein
VCQVKWAWFSDDKIVVAWTGESGNEELVFKGSVLVGEEENF